VRTRPIPELASPVPLAAVAVLALNDHVLERAFPGRLTGKLSDLVGCFVLPLFLSAVLAFVTRWRAPFRLALGAAVTVGFFAAIKLSPPAASMVARAGGRDEAARPPGWPHRSRPDRPRRAPPRAGRVGVRRERPRARGGGPVSARSLLGASGRLAALAATALTLLATSVAPCYPEDSGAFDADTTCGPPGVVTLAYEGASQGCGGDGNDCWGFVEARGANAVGLPEQGEINPVPESHRDPVFGRARASR
jgi:hypothetical protein